MKAGIHRRLTYANVMSTIAVFGIFAGGGAWAASKIGPGEIAGNAVRAKHIKKNQVRSKHLKDGQIRSVDLADGAVTPVKLADGEAVSGPVSGLETVIGWNPAPSGSPGNSESPKNTIVTCPAGKRAIAGGALISGGFTGSHPSLVSQTALHGLVVSGNQVIATAVETTATGGTWALQGRAICANVN